MEETVRSMLQYKARSEQLKQEKTSLTVAYEVSQHCHMGVTPLRHVVNMAPPIFALRTMNCRLTGVTVDTSAGIHVL